MIVSFFSGVGKGQGKGILYLTQERDREGKIRFPEPEIVRGETERTIELIDANPWAQKYTSGALSFTEKDLSKGTLEGIIDDFESRAIVPGLEKDQYNSLWVSHRHEGKLELHFVIVDQELTTGKRLQPYYHFSADRARVDAWKEITNFDLGLSDPNAPKRKQGLTIAKNLPGGRKEAAREINTGVENLIAAGGIKNREDVVRVLKDVGFTVTRETKSSISIVHEGSTQPLRLKGVYYGRDFDVSKTTAAGLRRATTDYERERKEAMPELREKFERLVSRRREQLQCKYRAVNREHKLELGKEHQGIQQQLKDGVSAKRDLVFTNNFSGGDSTFERVLEMGASGIKGGDKREQELSLKPGREFKEGKVLQGPGGWEAVRGDSEKQSISGPKWAILGRNETSKIGGAYDRAREAIALHLKAVRERLRRAREGFKRTLRRFHETLQQGFGDLRAGHGELNRSLQRGDRVIKSRKKALELARNRSRGRGLGIGF